MYRYRKMCMYRFDLKDRIHLRTEILDLGNGDVPLEVMTW